jgi:hypothetical protein
MIRALAQTNGAILGQEPIGRPSPFLISSTPAITVVLTAPCREEYPSFLGLAIVTCPCSIRTLLWSIGRCHHNTVARQQAREGRIIEQVHRFANRRSHTACREAGCQKNHALPVWPILWTITGNALASGPLQHALRRLCRLFPAPARFSPTLGVSERLAASVWALQTGAAATMRERRGNRPAPWRPVRVLGLGSAGRQPQPPLPCAAMARQAPENPSARHAIPGASVSPFTTSCSCSRTASPLGLRAAGVISSSLAPPKESHGRQPPR